MASQQPEPHSGWWAISIAPVRHLNIVYLATPFFVERDVIVDDQIEAHLGADIMKWLDGPVCVGGWHLVNEFRLVGRKTERHRQIIIFEQHKTALDFLEDFAHSIAMVKAKYWRRVYEKEKACLLELIDDGVFDLSKMGWRKRKDAVKLFLSLEARMFSARRKWRNLHKTVNVK